MNSTSTNNASLNTARMVGFAVVGLTLGLILSTLTVFLLRGVWSSDNKSLAENGLDMDASSSNYYNNSIQDSELNRLITAGTSITELRRLSEYLDSLDEQHLLNLVTASAIQKFPRQSSIQTMMFEYLVQSSPEHALECVWLFDEHRRAELLTTVFGHWSKIEIQKSIVAATGLNTPYREVAIDAILDSGSLSSEDLAALASMERFKQGLSNQDQERVVFELLDHQPQKAFDLLVSDDIKDFEQAELFSQVVDRLYEVEGLSVIAMLHNSDVKGGLKNKLFIEIADRDRAGTLVSLQSIPSHEQISLVSPLMKHWISLDAESALAEIRDLPESYFRSSILDTFLSEWARVDPGQVLDRLEEFPRNQRSRAALDAIREITLIDPTEALSRLTSLRTIPGAVNLETELVFVNTWADNAPLKAVEWVQSNAEKDSLERTRMLWRILPKLALSDPKKAMIVAQSEMPHPSWDRSGYDHMIVDSLIRTDKLQSAIDILDQVREEARHQSYSAVGTELVLKDRYDETISLSEKLPPQDRVRYFGSVIYPLLFENSSRVLTLIAQISNTRVRSDVVNNLLESDYTRERYFSAEQIETLRSLEVE